MNQTQPIHQLIRASVAVLTIALMIPSTVFGVADVLEMHRPLRDFDLRNWGQVQIAPLPPIDQ